MPCWLCFLYSIRPCADKLVFWRLHQLAIHSSNKLMSLSARPPGYFFRTGKQYTEAFWILAFYLTEDLITKGEVLISLAILCGVPAYAWHCTHHLWARLKTPILWGSDHHCSPEERTQGCEVGPHRVKVIPGTRCPPYELTLLPSA